MSCNGCRVLRKGCSDACVLRPSIEWIDGAQPQANATVFVAKFFGRAGLVASLAAVPLHHRPALFRSLLYEACGRIISPVSGGIGLMWTGNWDLCQAAADAVLRGESLRALSAIPAAFTDRDMDGLYGSAGVAASSSSPENSSSAPPSRKRRNTNGGLAFNAAQGFKFRRNFAEIRRKISFSLLTGKKNFGIFRKISFENSKFKKFRPKVIEIRRNLPKFRNEISFPLNTGICNENEMVNPDAAAAVPACQNPPAGLLQSCELDLCLTPASPMAGSGRRGCGGASDEYSATTTCEDLQAAGDVEARAPALLNLFN